MAEQAQITEAEVVTAVPPKVKKEVVVQVDSDTVKATSLIKKYLDEDQIADFASVPFHYKLAALQKTPDKFVLSRKIGGNEIWYVSHQYAEKALNFAFNFRVSSEILNHSLDTKVQKVNVRDADGQSVQEDRITHIGAAHVKFTFTLPDGGTIVRTVVSSHKAFSNPATTAEDALKSAVSKAWTVVARTFGIGTDVNDEDDVVEPSGVTQKRAAPVGSSEGGTCAECGKSTDAKWKKQCYGCYKKANPRT